MAMCYPAGSKIHAATDPHDPDKGVSETIDRDLVDLVLIKQLSDSTGHPSKSDIKRAGHRHFEARCERSGEGRS